MMNGGGGSTAGEIIPSQETTKPPSGSATTSGSSAPSRSRELTVKLPPAGAPDSSRSCPKTWPPLAGPLGSAQTTTDVPSARTATAGATDSTIPACRALSVTGIPKGLPSGSKRRTRTRYPYGGPEPKSSSSHTTRVRPDGCTATATRPTSKWGSAFATSIDKARGVRSASNKESQTAVAVAPGHRRPAGAVGRQADAGQGRAAGGARIDRPIQQACSGVVGRGGRPGGAEGRRPKPPTRRRRSRRRRPAPPPPPGSRRPLRRRGSTLRSTAGRPDRAGVRSGGARRLPCRRSTRR